jgi:lysophospholipase L1-like esterase
MLQALRAAAPESELIVNGAWHSVLAADVAPLFDLQFAGLNATIARQAALAGARLADLATIFNPPGVAARVAAIRTFTLLCSDGDGHPSDTGYGAIAGALFVASGYSRLDE